MKSFAIKTLFSLVVLLMYTSVSAQVTIEQDDTFSKLLDEKRTQNQLLNFKGVYTIQIFSGNYTEANEVIDKSLLEFEDLDQSIEFKTPSYKIWVGCFKNRIDAERTLSRLYEEYPSAFVIKLKK